jgi:hypothetical protein
MKKQNRAQDVSGYFSARGAKDTAGISGRQLFRHRSQGN